MGTTDEKVGYMAGKLEEIHDDIVDIKRSHQELLTRVTKIEHDSTYRAVAIKLIKLLSMTLAFILAFKFGDIGELWRQFFRP